MAESHNFKICGEPGINCARVCNKLFHSSIKCTGTDQYSAKILEVNLYSIYMRRWSSLCT